MRNSAAARFGDKRFVIAGLVDTSGYAADVRAKYEGFFITDSPVVINGSNLETGAYGFGFSNDGKLQILDLGGNQIFSVATTKDGELKKAAPLDDDRIGRRHQILQRQRLRLGDTPVINMKLRYFSRVGSAGLVLCSVLCLVYFAQTPSKPDGQGGGVVTGTPVNYSSRRTVGITDPKAPVILKTPPTKPPWQTSNIRPARRPRITFSKYRRAGGSISTTTGDGLPDIYLVNGSTMQALLGKKSRRGPRFTDNLGIGSSKM